MGYGLILIGVLTLTISGCATTRQSSQHDQLQARVVDLEKKIEEKDAEIVDLQYEVKDLSSKLESNRVSSSFESDATAVPATVVKTSSEGVLRVNVSPETLQQALKNAGVYSGKIDGKIGNGTKAAIKEFQKAHGLTADGVVGKRTWDELKAYLK